jgi:HEPN domain-containing protein
MQPDPARIDETRGWLQKAAKDLRAASHDLEAVPPLVDDVAFHCQQAVENAQGFSRLA